MSKLKKAFLDDPAVEPEGDDSENAPATPAPQGEAPKAEGLRIVRGLGVPPRTRLAGVSKYDIGSLEVGDAFVSTLLKDVRNVTVAARAYSKRIAANGGVAPKFVTRKTADGSYALTRES